MPLGDRVAALDPLRELHLLGRVQQLVAADVGEEELEAVGGAGGDSATGSRLGLLLLLLGFLLGLVLGRARLPDLEAERLELARELLRAPRRSGRARARTPRTRRARSTRAPPSARRAPSPAPTRTVRSAGSASKSNVSPFRRSFVRSYKLTHLYAVILLFPGVRGPADLSQTQNGEPCLSIPVRGAESVFARRHASASESRPPRRQTHGRHGKFAALRSNYAAERLPPLRFRFGAGPFARRSASSSAARSIVSVSTVVAAAQARVRLAVGHVGAEAAVLEHDRLAADRDRGRARAAAASPAPRPRRCFGWARSASASSSVIVNSCSSLSSERDSAPFFTYGP